MDFGRVIRGQAAGKALPPHPALMSDDPISTYGPGAPRTEATLTQREAHRHLEAYGGSQTIDWVTDCVDLYADTASTADFHLERDGKRVWLERTDDTPAEDEVADLLLRNLLEKPNPFMDWSELVHLLVTDLLLVGNGYWLKYRMTEAGKPLALYRLAPAYVKIVPGPWGVERYEYQPPGAKDPLKLSPEEVMHFKRPNPHSAYYGMGVIQSGGRPLDLELALTDTQASYYENKADPSVVFQAERRVPRDVINKLRAQLRARTSGPRRAGEILVLESGLRAETLSNSAKDALFDILTRLSRDRIFAMFRASPLLFGIIDQTAGQTKIPDAQRQFDNKVMRPFLKKLQTKITLDLLAAWGYDFVFDHRYIMPEEELVKLSGDLGNVPGIKVKEVRGFLRDGGIIADASTGDDEIDEMVLNLPGEELGEDGQPVDGEAGFADRPLPREAGRPPKGENTRAFPADGNLPAGARARSPQGKAVMSELEARLAAVPETKAVPSFEAPDHVSVGRKLTGEERPQDAVAGLRDDEVDAIAATLRSDLLDATHVVERQLLDHVEGKAFEPGSLTKRVRGSEAWKTFMSMASAAMEKAALRAVSSAAIHQGGVGIVPESDLDYEAIVREVVYRPEGVRSITANLKDEVVSKIAGSIKDDASREDVERVVREIIDFWRVTHAETVAITEATHAYNEGTLTVAEAAGIGEVVVEDGHDHDDECAEADGQVWDIATARQRRLEHPRCRRGFTPLPTSTVA